MLKLAFATAQLSVEQQGIHERPCAIRIVSGKHERFRYLLYQLPSIGQMHLTRLTDVGHR